MLSVSHLTAGMSKTAALRIAGTALGRLMKQ
jgi:hypothetical protein